MDWVGELNTMVSSVGVPGVVIVLWAVMPLIILSTFTMIIISNGKRSKENEKLKIKNDVVLADQLGSLASSITILSSQILHPPLNTVDAIDYYYLLRSFYVRKKIGYLGEILEKNCIHERQDQIKKNINKEFWNITMLECSKLSKKITCAGDMGKIVQEVIDWDAFMFEIFYIFFGPIAPDLSDQRKREMDHLKIKDIEVHINSEIDKIAEVIRERGVHN